MNRRSSSTGGSLCLESIMSKHRRIVTRCNGCDANGMRRIFTGENGESSHLGRCGDCGGHKCIPAWLLSNGSILTVPADSGPDWTPEELDTWAMLTDDWHAEATAIDGPDTAAAVDDFVRGL